MCYKTIEEEKMIKIHLMSEAKSLVSVEKTCTQCISMGTESKVSLFDKIRLKQQLILTIFFCLSLFLSPSSTFRFRVKKQQTYDTSTDRVTLNSRLINLSSTKKSQVKQRERERKREIRSIQVES